MTESRFPTIFNDEVNLDFEQRCYPDATDIKVFRYRDDPPAYQIWAGFDGIRQLIEELGAPHHVNRIYCVRLSRAEEFFKTNRLPSKRFLSYSVERFGLRIEPFPILKGEGKSPQLIRDSSLYTDQPSYWHERHDYLVQIWRTRVFACQVDHLNASLSAPLSIPRPLQMYMEECWHPMRGKSRSLHWLEPRDSNNSKIDRFKKDALLILDGVNRIGRPPGTKKYNAQSEFVLEYEKACSIVKRRGKLRQDLVAGIMEISPSTLYRRLREYHLKWSRQ
jgi:hypothetical protein